MSCGEFEGEVFADPTTGEYLGGFDQGTDAFGDPFGWLHCMGHCETSSGIFRDFYDTPCACGGGDPNPPRASVPFEFSTQRLTVVADGSGPTGLEALPAMQVDGSGADGAAIAWAGTQVLDATTGAFKNGLINGDTGWHPKFGEQWTFQTWAKVVADYQGYLISDCELAFTASVTGFATGFVDESFPLTDEWTFMQADFTWGGPDTGPGETYGWTWPVIEFHGSDLQRREPRTIDILGTPTTLEFYIARGRILLKCAHLYPARPKTWWLANQHGRDID